MQWNRDKIFGHRVAGLDHGVSYCTFHNINVASNPLKKTTNNEVAKMLKPLPDRRLIALEVEACTTPDDAAAEPVEDPVDDPVDFNY